LVDHYNYEDNLMVPRNLTSGSQVFEIVYFMVLCFFSPFLWNWNTIIL